jgi:hypothetical protein
MPIKLWVAVDAIADVSTHFPPKYLRVYSQSQTKGQAK